MDQLKDALKVAVRLLDEYDGRDRQHQTWQLFEGLVCQTPKDIDFSSESEELQKYTSNDLAKFLAAVREMKSTKSLDSKRINNLFHKLVEYLSEHRPRIEELAVSMGLTVIPVLKYRKGGGANNHSLYWIEAYEFDVDASSQSEQFSPVTTLSPGPKSQVEIEYYLEALPKLPFWSRFFKSIRFGDNSLGRWILALTVASPFFCLTVLSIVTLLIINGTITEINSKLYSLLLMYPFLYFFGFSFLIKALNNSVALLPHWMLPRRLDSALLQLTIDGSPDRNYRVKELGIKVYAAKCPVCNHRVDLKSGGLKHWGRIIGVCDNNPIEHRYSFDFTNLTGNKLR